MLSSVQNDTSSRSSMPNWLTGRGVPTKRHKAKQTHGRLAAQKIPSSMLAGQSYGVSVSMMNIGSTTWMPTTLHNLGSQDPEDNEMWGMGRVIMPVASAAPGDTVEFVWTVTAPLTPGSYAFQWEMVQDGVEHFGDFSPLVTVTVAASELGVPDGLLNAVWDSDNLLLELDGALSTTGRYTDSPGMWGGLVSEWQSAQLINSWDAAGSSFYGYDSQSSTRLLTNASGVVTDNYAYRAFGTEWHSGNGSRNSYRYVGQYGYYRDCAAMQYVRARYLDVQAGRWVSQDPIGYDGGDWNLYRYVGNEPINLPILSILHTSDQYNLKDFRNNQKKKPCDTISESCIQYLVAHYGGEGKGNCLLKEFPHAASDIKGCACKYGMNDLLLLAVAWCESNFGHVDKPPCDPRNLHNPFSCHFCPTAKGRNKLKYCNGCYPTLAQSACCAAHIIKDNNGLGGGAWGSFTISCVPGVMSKMLKMCKKAKL